MEEIPNAIILIAVVAIIGGISAIKRFCVSSTSWNGTTLWYLGRVPGKRLLFLRSEHDYTGRFGRYQRAFKLVGPYRTGSGRNHKGLFVKYSMRNGNSLWNSRPCVHGTLSRKDARTGRSLLALSGPGGSALPPRT